MNSIKDTNEINNKLSTEQLNKMSVEEILASNGFKNVNNELVRLEETEGNVLSLQTCTTLTLQTPASLTLGIPIGPSTAQVGTTSLTYTVLVSNSGDMDGTTQVTLYEGFQPSLISTGGTGTVPGHGTYLMTFNFNPSGWLAGTYQICAKIGPY